MLSEYALIRDYGRLTLILNEHEPFDSNTMSDGIERDGEGNECKPPPTFDDFLAIHYPSTEQR